MVDAEIRNIPIPDPSLLTTVQFERGQEAFRREMSSLREFLISEMNRIEKVHEEKFRSLEARVSEGKVEGRSSLDAAFKAASAAAEKSEAFFTKQIEANEAQTFTITSALREQLDDIKLRVASGESLTKGAVDNTTKIMAAVTLVILLAMSVFTIASHSFSTPTVSSPAVVPMQPTK